MECQPVGIRGYVVIDGSPSVLIKGLIGVEKLWTGGLGG
jgi:hypothetical protein